MATGGGWEKLASGTQGQHTAEPRGETALPRQKALLFHFRRSRVRSRGLKIHTQTPTVLTVWQALLSEFTRIRPFNPYLP